VNAIGSISIVIGYQNASHCLTAYRHRLSPVSLGNQRSAETADYRATKTSAVAAKASVAPRPNAAGASYAVNTRPKTTLAANAPMPRTAL
jgi:hypothetical protein